MINVLLYFHVCLIFHSHLTLFSLNRFVIVHRDGILSPPESQARAVPLEDGDHLHRASQARAVPPADGAHLHQESLARADPAGGAHRPRASLARDQVGMIVTAAVGHLESLERAVEAAHGAAAAVGRPLASPVRVVGNQQGRE